MFKRGDIVCYRATFLRSVGWYTNVPIDGKVTNDADPEVVSVQWCDQDVPVRVNAKNLILKRNLHLEPA